MFLHGKAVSLVKDEREKADAPQTVLMSVSRFSQCAIHIRGVRHKRKLGVCKPRISALKWGAGGWAGGLHRKLKEIGVGSKHLKLKMFSKKTRELIKTHSVSKKSRTGNSPSPLNSPSVSRTASLLTINLIDISLSRSCSRLLFDVAEKFTNVISVFKHKCRIQVDYWDRYVI